MKKSTLQRVTNAEKYYLSYASQSAQGVRVYSVAFYKGMPLNMFVQLYS